MKDLYDEIEALNETEKDVRADVLKELKDFVKERGKRKDDQWTLTVNSDIREVIEVPYALSEDRHMDGCLINSQLESMTVTDAGALLIETETSVQDSSYLLTSELIDIYGFLKYFEDENPEDLRIKNGTIELTEE